MYTVLTSFPEIGCGNTGDKLIEIAVKQIIEREKGETEFLTLFREHNLQNKIALINKTKAVIMPAFPIRDVPMYPGVYTLVENLEEIKVPLIPIGANWNVYPGDYFDRQSVKYSKETVGFLKYVSARTENISCREYHACRILNKHGIGNTIMTGDPAWYDLDYIGKKMRRPSEVGKLVFTPPLSAFFEEQAKDLLRMLSKLFPDAVKFCSFHLADMISRPLPEGQKSDNSVAMNKDIAEKNERIRKVARKEGFEVVLASHDISKIDFYNECDLHVGYECHAHWAFIRKRIPSVLIAEDARGVGFIYTQGLTGFEGFARCQRPKADGNRPSNTSGYCDSLKAYSAAIADITLADRVKEFLEDELESNFRRYAGFADLIDEVYETRMKPFIVSLP